jgi:hypothetical protein
MRDRHLERSKSLFKLDVANPHVMKAASFLSKFGYLEPGLVGNAEAVEHALKLYQRFYGLAPTGQFTLETIKHMNQPRCGNPDPVAALVTDGTAEADPIVYFGNRWGKTNITYFIDRFTSDMTGEETVIQNAFDVWAAVTPLTFSRVFSQGSADVIVSWEVFDHGDGSAFDGVGNVLAHATSPGTGAFVHFDDSENWNANRLLSTAIHEVGHALGLGHSREKNSVMYATENGKTTLHELDIKGIRSRYPQIVNFGSARAARVSLWGLKNSGGCEVKRVVFAESRPLIAWVQCSMVDPLTDFDKDNAWAAEIIEVDENRVDTKVHGGAHWGSNGSPNNVHHGAYAATARSVTFRVSATHTADLDVFGVGCVLIL